MDGNGRYSSGIPVSSWFMLGPKYNKLLWINGVVCLLYSVWCDYNGGKNRASTVVWCLQWHLPHSASMPATHVHKICVRIPRSRHGAAGAHRISSFIEVFTERCLILCHINMRPLNFKVVNLKKGYKIGKHFWWGR